MDKLKISTKITTIEEAAKALQSVEKSFNKLLEKVNSPAEKELKETEGETGDIQVAQNLDKSYTFLVKTEDGWKTPVIGDSAIKFKDKPSTLSAEKKETIDEIESKDSSTGDTKAKKTIYDEKNDKFVLPRPDYDSGWTEDASTDAAITLEHNLNTVTFSLIDIQFSNSSTGANATWANSVTDDDPGAYIVQVKDANNIYVGTGDDGPPSIDCAGLTWENQDATHFRLRLWK